MKIGIDVTSLCRKLTGFEYYTLNLTRNILQNDQTNEYVLFFRQNVHPELKQFSRRVKFSICRRNQIYCEQIWLPYQARKERVDIMHFPAFPPGILSKKNFILTIHDAVPWKYRHTLSWKGKFYIKPLMTMGAKKAKKIITVSENSKHDIQKYTKIPLDKIINTSESINRIFKIIKDQKRLDQVRNKYSLPIKFILAVGSLEPRKNLSNLLEAYNHMRKTNAKIKHKLVLVGRKAWGGKALAAKIKSLKLEKDIISLGYIAEDELICIFNLAEIFIYPSIYEGFGLPPLESMACGTPVIASQTSSLPEIIGDAGILINPFDIKEISQAIQKLLLNPTQQDELILAGLARLKYFSWKKVVKTTINIYKLFEPKNSV